MNAAMSWAWWILVIVCASGCVRMRAYERELLAHPTMSLSAVAGPAGAHVYAVQEGATGGDSGVGGGGGCN